MEHLILNNGSDSVALAEVALKALREARKSKTSNSGSVFVSDGQTDDDGIALGTGTIINGVDGGIQPWVGDTTPPGRPTGLTASSRNAAITVMWDGTLEGGIPSDFHHITVTGVRSSDSAIMTFGDLSSAGSLAMAELNDGDEWTITAIAYDDAHLADGTSAPNASAMSDAVTVTVESAVSADEVQAIQSDLSQAQSDIASAESSMTDLTRTVSTVDGKATTSGNAPTTGDASGKPEGAMWYVTGASGNITGTYVLKSGKWAKYTWASSSIADEVNQAISDAASAASTAQKTADAAKSSAETNSNDLTAFINETTDNLSSLQSQVDGSITTWFYCVAPTASNKPASDWTTTDMKNNHLGDLYYDTITGYCYRYQVSNNTYSWARISDVDVTKALSDAAAAQDTADSKRRVFTGTPKTPYDVGDLWVQGASGDILRCGTAKTSSQSYNASDWVKASKYTDDTLAGQAHQAAVTAQGAADAAQTAADNAKKLAESSQSTVDSLRASARNLLAGTDVEFTNTYPSSGVSDKWTAFTIAPATDSEYVLTFEASSTVDGDKVRCNFYNPSTTTSAETSTGFTCANDDGLAIVTLTTTPQRYWVKWTQSATTTTKKVIVGRCMPGDGTGTVTVRQPMLVAGNIPADWTPAPEDISDKISAAQSTADTAQTIASAAQSAASAAKSSADAAQDAATAAQTTADGKNKVVRSTSAPSSTSGYKTGDQWWVYSGGTVTALYLYSGSAWVNSQLGVNALSDGAVSTAKLAANAVTSAKLAAGSVGSSQLAAAVTQSISDAQDAATAAQSTADTAKSNAATAQSTADAAKSAASTAQSAASAAQTTADGKNKVVRSTSAPSSTSGYSSGDQWWVYSGSTVTALYLYSGTAWVSQTITNSVIANLDAGKITTGSISADRISAGSLTAAKLASGTITAASGVLGSASVVNATIADAAISSAKIADASITNAKIADATIQSAKISNLDAGKITSGYVNADRIQAGSITGAKVAAGTITASNMVAGTLTAASGIIANAAIGSAQIIDGSIGTAEIADAAIKNAKIADAAISTAKIADAAITNAKIASLDAGKITSGYVDAARIAADSITADKLLVGGGSDLSPNPTFDPSGPLLGTPHSWIPGNGGHSVKLTGRDNMFPASTAFTVSKGDTFCITCEAAPTAGTAPLKLGLWWTVSPSTATSIRPWTNINLATDLGQSANDPNWHKYSATISVPTASDAVVTAAQGYIGMETVAENTWLIGNYHIYKVSDGTLIADGSISTNKLVAGAVTADKLAANSVTAVKLASKAVNADKADIGSLTAAIVSSGKFKTSNGRMLINDDGLTAKDANGNTTVNIPSDGSTPTMVGGLSTASNGKRISISQSGGVGAISMLNGNTELTSLTFLDDTAHSGYVYTGLYTGQNGQFLQFATLVDTVNYQPNPLQYDASFTSNGKMLIDASDAINVNGTWFARDKASLPPNPYLLGDSGTTGFAGGTEYTFDGDVWSATSHRVFTGSKVITGTGTSEYTFLSNAEYNAIVGRDPTYGDVITFTNGDRASGVFTSAFGVIDNANHSVNVVFPVNVSGARRLNYCITCND